MATPIPGSYRAPGAGVTERFMNVNVAFPGSYPEPVPVTGFMPALPPGLTEWLPSGFITAFLGLLWYEQKAGEARLNKRIDELKTDMKADMKELREKVDALPWKLMEALRANQPVTPER
ncbi:MAG: hypothetical protein F4025_02365 [Synechococcus sp. SB0669_bin_7]|nr:hypothetical protein [Cyanobacteria bacterium MAG IRC3_bin_20]MYK85264.1 hypothetical protein [Synechococcus sp. SB0669_bin_7]